MDENLETTGNEPQTPSVDPAGDAPSASPAPSPSVDPSVSLNQQLQAQLGISVEDVKNLRAGMNQAQREAAEAKKRLRALEPIIEYGERDPNFVPYLYEQTRAYGNGQGPDQIQVDRSVLNVLDPIQQRLRASEDRIAAWEFHQNMNSLGSEYPDFVDANVKQQLALDAEATGNYDLEYHFFKRYGRSLMEKAKAKGTNEAVKQMQHQNQLYKTGVTTTSVAPPTPVAQMNEAQKEKFINDEFERIMSDPDYAAKIAREVG